MSARQQTILNALISYGRLSSFDLSRWVDWNNPPPEASIRRDIQALRRLGHNISFASANGYYTLGRPNV